MERPGLFRILALVLAVAAIIATLAVTDRDPATPPSSDNATARPDTLADDLRRCVLADTDDTRCRDVWAESRRRFFSGRAKAPAPPEGGAP